MDQPYLELQKELIKTMLIRAIIQGLTYVEAVDVLGWINTAEDFCDWFVRI